MGHEGTIINTPDRTQIIRDLTKEKYDFIHVHYDVFYDIMDYIHTAHEETEKIYLTIPAGVDDNEIINVEKKGNVYNNKNGNIKVL